MKTKKLTQFEQQWTQAEKLLAGLGVWRILPEIRDLVKCSSSPPHPGARALAFAYLQELLHYSTISSGKEVG